MERPSLMLVHNDMHFHREYRRAFFPTSPHANAEVPRELRLFPQIQFDAPLHPLAGSH
jgi:hypothetical protein